MCVCGTSNQAFHTSVLHTRMHSFQFSHDPIDLLIRKLLMMVDLPVKTQQIDRLIESFSKRYVECNPKLFNNSAQMSKNDCVKNTRMDGIPIELLEYPSSKLMGKKHNEIEDGNLCFE
ncbi:hypothetical protein PSHT_11926 [Puccinia striiformis]|uniref:SEC7 domain-containing protein n=1 Tax=Puccinia striiformis TaxID=27350 RepID=A0A2S4V033_9BASI|nr:hypothetical protein PSHT_11926 [Puccinia striiformis]